MRGTLDPASLAERALSEADTAAARASVEVRLLDDVDSIAAASRLIDEIWGDEGGEAQLPANVLRALVHAGNHAAGAFTDEGLVGAVVGFLGTDDDGAYLHSHILGVSGARRGSSVGFALKLHQRAWALGRGLRKITWTFDPLVRRNAYFNLAKLGASAGAYHERFYGEMRDGINAGDESDRLLVVWRLDSERDVVVQTEPSGDGIALGIGAGDEPQPGSTSSPRIWCATPPDILDLRSQDADLALRWRRALRSTLGSAMSDGYAVTGFTRSGWYVLDAT